MTEMNLEEIERNVKSYYEDVIDGYLLHDIETLLDRNLNLDQKEKGGCAAPLAMVILAAMNQLGYLTSKKTTDDIENNTKTDVCIQEFCNDWMTKVDRENYKKSTFQEILINFFRHGLAHQYLSVVSTGLTRDQSQSQILLIKQNNDGKRFYILQVCILANNLKEAIEKLREKIDKAKKNDPDFLKRFNSRLVSQKEKYLKKNETLIKKAETNLNQNTNDEQNISPKISGMYS